MMISPIDDTRPVRDGEQLDVARLQDYLAAHLPAAAGNTLAVEQFPHGHSNLTYLIRSGRPRMGSASPPVRQSRQDGPRHGPRVPHTVAALPRLPPAPPPLLYCDDESILGAPFYLMERRKGVILRGSPPRDRPIPPDLVRRLCETLVDNMALLHSLDYRAAGLDDLGKPSGYVEPRYPAGSSGIRMPAPTKCPTSSERSSGWRPTARPNQIWRP